MATKLGPADPVLHALVKYLAPQPRKAVIRRHEAMLRELAFLHEKQDENLRFILSKKWTDKRLSVLFSLNSVYQEVVGPLSASARGGRAGLGTEYPILHGATRFDAAHAARARSAAQDFFEMIRELDFQTDWMTKNTCGDLIFYIARHERGLVAGDGQGDSP